MTSTMGADEQAAKIGRKIGLKGSPGYFVGLGIVMFLGLLLYFLVQPLAQEYSDKVRSGLSRAKASVTNTPSSESSTEPFSGWS